ncbi:hypothetical protein MP478_04525 [Chryseobacterium sp. WG14]|uniref:hypothetical protein n=1 Tax=Chryseobacterium sp. WG14 TaxID=2926909 RepID=UPI00211E37CE|nr:hypothetical protein [Chryseobacterium sp. WG14]MCQ9638645.1 hypothetical protein [Chryseobacterium sp. WG14]
MKITEKVKSFEDACQILGIEPNIPQVEMLPENHKKAIIAHYKLIIIAEALNEGWVPDWQNSNQTKYFPWFKMGSSSGSGFSFYGYDDWNSGSAVGSRLCFKSRELAEYAGKQFTEIYKKYMTI